jgi:serine/threonine-protein kinase PknG
MAPVDPATAVMEVALVPEDRRYCSGCGAPVGRGRDGETGRVSGFCGKCRLPFSFLPELNPNDLVAGQYRVAGCLAYGGLGWIYLADDQHVANRWVALKGLLNARDPAAMEAAMAERRFLAGVEHPNVVRIYNFVQHAGAGYLVMEYLGGMTLKDVLKERRRAAQGPLPIDSAIAYVLAMLPAFSHLHGLGLIYNDCKPDNAMLHADSVKLIDLGAVTRLGEAFTSVYGTDGYQAPEMAVRGPSVASDLYSIGRCLAMLVLDLPEYQGAYRHRLPDADQEPLFQRYESFHRFLLRASATEPEDRFSSADEMAEQLYGVLRDVVAINGGSPRTVPSNLFGADLPHLQLDAATAGPSLWRQLPTIKLDPADAASSLVLDAMMLEPAHRVKVLEEAIDQGGVPATAEVRLSLARALIETGAHAAAEDCLGRIEAPRDWRISWYRGLSLLAQGRPAHAWPAFDQVYGQVPGELAPKLAVALAAERAGSLDTAARLYRVVASADPGFVSACFGLARVCLASGDRAGAVQAYERIPPTSSLHTDAQVQMARALMRTDGPTDESVADLVRAAAAIERLALDGERRTWLTIELLEAALGLATSESPPAASVTLLGQPLEERPLRLALERAYRELARRAAGVEKIQLVDRANEVRPWTAA